MSELIITRRTKVESGYELLADITVSSATTSVDISGLSLGKTNEIVLVSEILNTSASTSVYYLYFNGTTSGYYSQRITANNTTRNAARTSDARLIDIVASQKAVVITNIKLANSGYIVSQNNSNENHGSSSILLNNYYATTTFTASSITQITITGSISNSIGIGSRFQLYKVV